MQLGPKVYISPPAGTAPRNYGVSETCHLLQEAGRKTYGLGALKFLCKTSPVCSQFGLLH